MGSTLIEKILGNRVGREVNAGEILGDLPVDLAWGSEMTLKYAVDILEQLGLLDGDYDDQIKAHSDIVMFPFDHLIPARDRESASMMVDLRNFAEKYGIKVFDVGYDGGIQHRLFEERGYLYPGRVGLGADSHSCTYGALASAGTGIGSSDLAAIMISGKTWLMVPHSIRVNLTGSTKDYVTGKDLILYLLGLLGEDGANYHALEFWGEGVKHLDMASRFTISNMAVEGGAKMGLFPVDNITINYLTQTVAKDFPEDIRFKAEEINKFSIFKADEDACYEKTLAANLDSLEPMVALPYLPGNSLGIHQLNYILKNRHVFADNETVLQRISAISQRADSNGNIPIQQVFIGSCTNARIEDLRVAAEILKGKQVAKGVRALVIPASQHVFRQAMTEGLVNIFLDAGCYVESSSCGPCIGFKSGVMGKDETAIFTSNRNFYGRTGDKSSLVILASPAVAAKSALEGKLASPEPMETYYESESDLVKSIINFTGMAKKLQSEKQAMFYQAEVKPYAPQPDEKGKTAWKFGDNINTDLIMPARYCNITDPDIYKKYLLLDAQNHEFLAHYEKASCDLSSDIIVGGTNFGCGSSRESAPTAIKKAGVQIVAAHSFARIFYRNAVNLGLPIFELGEAAFKIRQGDLLRANPETGEIFNITRKEVYQARPLAPYHKEIHRAGGIIEKIKKQHKKPDNKCLATGATS